MADEDVPKEPYPDASRKTVEPPQRPPQWSCMKRFVLKSGEFSPEAEAALYKQNVRPSFTPGVFRWSAYIRAETEAEAVTMANQMLVELLGPYDVLVMVIDSHNLPVREKIGFCGDYCEHNADKECPCDSCVWIRTNTGFVHEFGCPYAPES